MKILELMHSLEEAYERFGDIKVSIDGFECGRDFLHLYEIKEIIIEAEEVIIKCE